MSEVLSLYEHIRFIQSYFGIIELELDTNQA